MRHGHRQAVAGHIWQKTQRQAIYTNIIMRSTNLPGYPLITHLSLLSVIESAAVFFCICSKFMVSFGDIPGRHGLPLYNFDQVTQLVLDIDILVVADSIQADNRPGPWFLHQARWKTSRECGAFQHEKTLPSVYRLPHHGGLLLDVVSF